MISIRRLRRWWQLKTHQQETPFDGEMPFWMMSFAFHLVLLIILATIFINPPSRKKITLLVPETEETEPLETVPELNFHDLEHDDIGANQENGVESIEALAPEIDDLVKVDRMQQLTPREIGEIDFSNYEPQPVSMSLESIPVKGAVGQVATGAKGAIDRITKEIMLSLEERETLVVWLFDQSASLMHQREEINHRLDRIYDQLGQIRDLGDDAFKKHGDQPLLTQVYAFGGSLNQMIKKPTDDVDKIQAAIRAIETDTSGVENVFSSICAVVDKFKHLRKIDRKTGDRNRNVLVVIISDEAGDDVGRLDQAVYMCQRYQIPIFVVGVPAPFGRKHTLVKWVDPDPNYDQSPQWTPVSQGPETMYPERVKLNFRRAEQDEDLLDSGFGPFALTRLCYESSGSYFAVHPNRDTTRRVRASETGTYAAFINHFFEPAIMRKYRPDYVSEDAYKSQVRSNKARMALVRASKESWLTPMQPPRLVFERFDEAAFVNNVSLAQRAAARLEPKINGLYEILKTGESDRPKEVALRWKAGYDLAMGRVLATKIRAESYNSMLAMAKTKLKFNDARNNTWVLRSADEINTGSGAAKLAEKAKTYLQRVVDEHPDTPWAMLAKRELSEPIGWKWDETFRQPPQPPQPRQNNGNNNARRRPMPQPQPKTKRPPPKL